MMVLRASEGIHHRRQGVVHEIGDAWIGAFASGISNEAG